MQNHTDATTKKIPPHLTLKEIENAAVAILDMAESLGRRLKDNERGAFGWIMSAIEAESTWEQLAELSEEERAYWMRTIIEPVQRVVEPEQMLFGSDLAAMHDAREKEKVSEMTDEQKAVYGAARPYNPRPVREGICVKDAELVSLYHEYLRGLVRIMREAETLGVELEPLASGEGEFVRKKTKRRVKKAYPSLFAEDVA